MEIQHQSMSMLSVEEATKAGAAFAHAAPQAAMMSETEIGRCLSLALATPPYLPWIIGTLRADPDISAAIARGHLELV